MSLCHLPEDSFDIASVGDSLTAVYVLLQLSPSRVLVTLLVGDESDAAVGDADGPVQCERSLVGGQCCRLFPCRSRLERVDQRSIRRALRPRAAPSGSEAMWRCPSPT